MPGSGRHFLCVGSSWRHAGRILRRGTNEQAHVPGFPPEMALLFGPCTRLHQLPSRLPGEGADGRCPGAAQWRNAIHRPLFAQQAAVGLAGNRRPWARPQRGARAVGKGSLVPKLVSPPRSTPSTRISKRAGFGLCPTLSGHSLHVTRDVMEINHVLGRLLAGIHAHSDRPCDPIRAPSRS